MSRARPAITPMPGRNWHSYIGPQTAPTTHLSMGRFRLRARRPADGPRPRVRRGDRVLTCFPGRGRARLRRGPCRTRGRRRGPSSGRNVPRHRVRRPRAARTALRYSLRRSCPAPTRRTRRVDPGARVRRGSDRPGPAGRHRLGNQTGPAIWEIIGDEGPRRSRQSQDRFRAGIAWSSVGSSRPARQAVGADGAIIDYRFERRETVPFRPPTPVISARFRCWSPMCLCPTPWTSPTGQHLAATQGKRS